MNPHDEKILECEEGQNLLDRLTLLTKKRCLLWVCVTYLPLDIDEDCETASPEFTFLSHSFTVCTESKGVQYRAVAHEWITLGGNGSMDLNLEITANTTERDARYYKIFPQKSIISFIDALLPVIVGSGETVTMFEKSRPPSNSAAVEIRDYPIVRLGDMLFHERRIRDFHRAVCHPTALKKLLSEITR